MWQIFICEKMGQVILKITNSLTGKSVDGTTCLNWQFESVVLEFFFLTPFLPTWTSFRFNLVALTEAWNWLIIIRRFIFWTNQFISQNYISDLKGEEKMIIPGGNPIK